MIDKINIGGFSDKNITVNFVWTAAHVVDNLRHVRQVIDPKTGQSKNVIEFKDAAIVKELVEDGRRVGELKMDARVIKYSDSENGEDLALLMIRKRDFVSSSAVFHTGSPNIVPIGTRLFHVGSLLGQTGAGSMTSGIMSQVGRVLDLGSSGGVVFDQTTVTALQQITSMSTQHEHSNEYTNYTTRVHSMSAHHECRV